MMNRRNLLPTHHYEDNSNGTLISSTGKPLRDYKIYGAVGGIGEIAVNNIDHTKITSKTTYGLTFTNNNDGTFTVNGTMSTVTIGFSLLNGVDLNEIEAGEPYFASSGNDLDDNIRRYYFFMQINDRVTGASRYFTTRTATTFTLSENEYISICEIRINAPTGELFEVDNVVFTPILCKASEYGYKIPVKTTGKNVFNEAYFFDVISYNETIAEYKPAYETIDGKEGLKVYGRNLRYIDDKEQDLWGFTAKENTQYTFSFDFYDIPQPQANGTDYYGVIFYCEYTDGTTDWNAFPVNANMRAKNEWRHWIFTTAVGKSVKRFVCMNQTGTAITYLANMQIEEGATETAFEPYNEINTNIFIPSQLAENDYIDYINKRIIIDGVATAADLPQIPTRKGTTNIIVDTNIPPSNAVWQYYRK